MRRGDARARVKLEIWGLPQLGWKQESGEVFVFGTADQIKIEQWCRFLASRYFQPHYCVQRPSQTMLHASKIRIFNTSQQTETTASPRKRQTARPPPLGSWLQRFSPSKPVNMKSQGDQCLSKQRQTARGKPMRDARTNACCETDQIKPPPRAPWPTCSWLGSPSVSGAGRRLSACLPVSRRRRQCARYCTSIAPASQPAHSLKHASCLVLVGSSSES